MLTTALSSAKMEPMSPARKVNTGSSMVALYPERRAKALTEGGSTAGDTNKSWTRAEAEDEVRELRLIRRSLETSPRAIFSHKFGKSGKAAGGKGNSAAIK